MDTARRLICIEGFDRVGKDTLLHRVGADWYKKVIVYEQPQVEDVGIDYRDSEAFSKYLENHFNRVVIDLKDLLKKPRCITMTRFLVSDNTYSNLFGRDHILQKVVDENNLLDGEIKLNVFLLLWKNYDEYLKRIDATNGKIEYSEEEFQKIQSMMENEALKLDGFIMYVEHSTSKDDIFVELGKYLGEKVDIKKLKKWS